MSPPIKNRKSFLLTSVVMFDQYFKGSIGVAHEALAAIPRVNILFNQDLAPEYVPSSSAFSLAVHLRFHSTEDLSLTSALQ
uniref:Uncharacterized protein n=1 Tax=Ditylenchus dipsaci TaxID=166011 RepID=A0A915DK28_9BILA